MLTEAASSRSRATKSEKQKAISPSKILEEIEQHVLLDGFKVVIDLDKSRGSYLHNAVSDKRLIDFYGFFGSMPVGFNHPHFDDPAVQRDLLRAAKVKIANSDVYSQGYAEFVETFERVVGLPPLERYLFIEGGAPAVENCLKAAMDWKVRKNMAAGHGERGTQILHFRRAFHGRSGYTMSLTNTDPRKTDLFAKFDWPRVSCPHIDFSLPESKREADVIAREQKAEHEIRDFITSATSTSAPLSSSQSRAKGVTIISAANGCRNCDRFATRTIFFSSLMKCNAAWAQRAATGAANIST